jgi:predicted GH43/DUF377 family glycosyl hydrolase
VTSTAVDPSWVRRTDHVLRPDPTRVVARLFLPGQEMSTSGESRSTVVLERVMALDDADVETQLAALTVRFAGRHRHLESLWEDHFQMVEHRVGATAVVSTSRRLLIGAYFTQEFGLEGAALFNPSMTRHPDQSGLPAGSTRFVMSVRAVGEGHLSSIEMRTGTIDAADAIAFEPAPEVAVLPFAVPTTYSRDALQRLMADLDGRRTNSDFVFRELPESFSRDELERALTTLREQRLTRGPAGHTGELLEWLAAGAYDVEFPADSTVQERVLMPRGPAESHGMEDVRLVRLDHADGTTEHVATYTAYDGERVGSHLLRTKDFCRFSVEQLSGPGARNKGLAIFPRTVGGRYLAVSRADRESNAVTSSDDLRHWVHPVLVQKPHEPWELVQLGNCGPPIETEAGWLVLTHGVGPMREYGIGALLLDLDHPTVVLASLPHPLLTPTADEREGYVPNVVYSCGALLHGRTLVLPYGCSDSFTRIALVDLDALLAELVPTSGARP